MLANIMFVLLTVHAVVHDIDAYGARRSDLNAVHVNAAAFQKALTASKPVVTPCDALPASRTMSTLFRPPTCAE